jgi:hypothetical protein
VRFWKARFTRIYPIYLLSLLLSWRMVGRSTEPHARDVLDGHGADAAAAAGLDSGHRHLPEHAGLDHVGRGLLLRALSLAGALEAAGALGPHLWKMAGVWGLGMVPGALYMAFNPDGIAHPDRWSYGPGCGRSNTRRCRIWPAFFGVMLAELDELMERTAVCASGWGWAALPASTAC